MEQIICRKCNISQPIENFNWRNKKKKIKHWHCKICQREYKKNFYNKDKENYKLKVLASNAKLKKRNFLFIKNYLENNACVQCGQNDWQLLEFDHLFGKEYNVSTMVHLHHSIEKIKQEIAKCQILCLYCHRKKTIKQLDWYKNYE